MKLILESDNDFVVENGELVSVNGKSFIAEKSDDELIVSDYRTGSCGSNNSINISGSGNSITRSFGGHGISINNNVVCVNGFKIKVSGSCVTIDGEATEIIYNGNNILSDINVSENVSEPRENEYSTYKLDTESISEIEVKSSGSLKIKNFNQCFSEDNLSFSVLGTGDIIFATNGHFAKNINASIMGSGDINISKIQSDSLSSSIMGSGDILFKNSDFNNAILSIMGSGDINFRASSAKNVNKNIMGSGDISGI